MGRAGIVLHASLSCIIILTLFSGTASKDIVNEILQRLEKVEKLNFDLKQDNLNLKLEMIDIKWKNRELKETVDEINIWMKSGHFQDSNKMDESNSDLKMENLKIKMEMTELRDQIDNVIRENSELKKKLNEIEDIMMFGNIYSNKSKPEIQSQIDSMHQPLSSHKSVKGYRKANNGRSVHRISKFLFDILFSRTYFNFQETNKCTSLVKKRIKVAFVFTYSFEFLHPQFSEKATLVIYRSY